MRYRTLIVLALVAVFLGWWLNPNRAYSEQPYTPVTKSCNGESGPEFYPCAYDARHEGNGRGRSYVLRRDGSVVFVPHWVAHRLRGL